jgi:hypothetical protein
VSNQKSSKVSLLDRGKCMHSTYVYVRSSHGSLSLQPPPTSSILR